MLSELFLIISINYDQEVLSAQFFNPTNTEMYPATAVRFREEVYFSSHEST